MNVEFHPPSNESTMLELKLIDSLYVPAATRIVSPVLAAERALEIVVYKQVEQTSLFAQ